MNINDRTTPEQLVFYTVQAGCAAMKHLTNVLESHVSHELAFTLSVEEATKLVERISNLADAPAQMMQLLLANEGREVLLRSVERHAQCWLVNLIELQHVVDTNRGWRDSVVRCERDLEALVKAAAEMGNCNSELALLG